MSLLLKAGPVLEPGQHGTMPMNQVSPKRDSCGVSSPFEVFTKHINFSSFFYFLFRVCRFNEIIDFFGIEVAVCALDLRPRISTGNVFQIDVNQFKEIS